ncbi:MAG TPA: glycosyltransferase family 4 protein [Acidimicrobiales bacterium]|nr:glycosyltransferase family 4 protein [Acidimicrobiales bacterium]
MDAAPLDIVVCGAHVPFMYGGAEQLLENLVSALRAAGHRAEVVRLPSAWDRERVFDAAMAWRMVPIDADMVIATNFPSYFVRHPHKVVWLFHQHRVVYDLAGTDLSDFDFDDGGLEEQRLLSEWDTHALEEASARFTLSAVVSDRLLRYNGLTSTPLPHPPPLFERLHSGGSDGPLFTALRLERNKRPDLLIDAMARTTSGISLEIAGTGSLRDELTARIDRLGLGDRVRLLGWTDDDDLVRHYAGARAVLYTPYDEDYGYVSLQGFAAGKPVVTTTDAGGVLEWVSDGVNGLVAQPDADSLAAAIDRLAGDDLLAQRLGRAGRDTVAGLSWEPVVQSLLTGALVR